MNRAQSLVVNPFLNRLVVGPSGSGKSAYLRALLEVALQQNPTTVLVLFDPKRVELFSYQNSPALLAPIADDAVTEKRLRKALAQEIAQRVHAQKTGSTKPAPLIVAVDEWSGLEEPTKLEHFLIQKNLKSLGISFILLSQNADSFGAAFRCLSKQIVHCPR